ncbi:MAG: CRTAC1 family protein [Planctomycetota bacterium]
MAIEALIGAGGGWRCEWLLASRSGSRELRWRIETRWSGARADTLEAFAFLEADETSAGAPLYSCRTAAILPSDAITARAQAAGGIEMVLRQDRLYPESTLYLGMRGVAAGDVDGDGREDLYVARSFGQPNQLFVRQPSGELVDRALEAGVADLEDTAGVLICDLDGDGARDLVAGVGSRLVISWTDGQGRFPERSILEVPGGGSDIYSICAADPDGDGDLDLYATCYFAGGRAGSAPTPYHDAENGAPNQYWRAQGPRQYELATAAVGLDQNNTRFSLAALWEDLDGDGDLDLYVTNDFGRNNLYRNEGGRFVDVAAGSDALDMAASMGISAADVNADGLVDLYISNMHTPAGMRVVRCDAFQAQAAPAVRDDYRGHVRGNTLLLGQAGGGLKREQGMDCAAPGGWSWGSVFLDFDNDWRPDLFVPNGFATGSLEQDLASFFWREVVGRSPETFAVSPAYLQAWSCITQLAIQDGFSWNGHERHYAYGNRGDGQFLDVSAASGLGLIEDGRGAAVCDWDMDGRADLWLSARTAPTLRFLHNETQNPHHFVAFELAGAAPNTEAVGALVQVRAGSAKYVARVYAGDAYLSAGSKRRLFGLGAHGDTVDVRVTWPDGAQQEFPGLAADRTWRLAREGEPRVLALTPLPGGWQASRPLSGHPGPPRSRVLPADRLPMSTWDLPTYARDRFVIAQAYPRPCLVVLYGSWPGGGMEGLERWATLRGRDDLALRIVSLDGPREDAAVRAMLAGYGLENVGGRGGRRLRNLVEMALGEVMGAAPDRPLPLGLLFDPAGRLAAIYLQEIDTDQVLNDAAALASEPLDAWEKGVDVLAGGRWLGPRPKRAIEALADFLARKGEAAWAAELQAAAGR